MVGASRTYRLWVMKTLFGPLAEVWLLAVSLFCFPFATLAQFWRPAIDSTNQVWKYLVQGPEAASDWTWPDFDDSSWPSGVGLFGFESTPFVYPYPFQTVWQPVDGRFTYYARTHFQWRLTWPTVHFQATNYLDDGAVFYLNGGEVGRIRMPEGTVTFNTPAQMAPTEGQPDVLEFGSEFLRDGDNVLAVEVHNATALSHDIVFGLSLRGIDCHFDIFPEITPRMQLVEECQSATITLVSPPAFYPGMRWFKNGEPLWAETNRVLTFTHVSAADAGNYYVEIPTPCEPQRTAPSLLVVVPMTSLGRLELSGAKNALQVHWEGCGVLQWSSNLVEWEDVPNRPVSPFAVGALADTRFFRLRSDP